MNAYMNKKTGKLLAAVAVLAMVVCAFAVAIPAEESDAASSDVVSEIGGGLRPVADDYVVQSYTSGEVVVISDYIIPDGTALIIGGNAKFTVNAGQTITIQAGGQLIFEGNANVTINGDIVAEGTDPAETDDAGYIGAIVNNINTNTVNKAGIKVYGNISLDKGAELISKTSSGSDITVGNNEESNASNSYVLSADSDKGDMTLYEGATVTLSKRSSSISIIDGQTVNLNPGSTLTIVGLIGEIGVTVNAVGDAN